MATANLKSEAEAGLGDFFAAAGQSLSDAQAALTANAGLTPSTLAISGADLEVKAAVTQTALGKLVLQTLSMQSLRSGIAPELVSTIQMHYVAVPGSTGPEPKRGAQEIREIVAKRDDIRRLAKILGELKIEPLFVPQRGEWLVIARDPESRVVRDLIIPDEPPRVPRP